MPLAIRRALPYVLPLTRAWTSTRIGRDPSTVQSTAEPGADSGRSERNSLDGFVTGTQAGAGHLEHAELADRTEAILDGAHDAMRVMALAFEVEHGVDDVLERLGAGEASLLRDVTDQKRRHVVSLRREEQLRRRLAYLPDAAGRRLQLQREDRLNGIDHQQRWADSRTISSVMRSRQVSASR